MTFEVYKYKQERTLRLILSRKEKTKGNDGGGGKENKQAEKGKKQKDNIFQVVKVNNIKS